MKQRGSITVQNTSGGDWLIVLAGAGAIALGVGLALLAGAIGTALLVVSIGASIGLAAIGVGRGLEHYQRGQAHKYIGLAMLESARRGELPEAMDDRRLLERG